MPIDMPVHYLSHYEICIPKTGSIGTTHLTTKQKRQLLILMRRYEKIIFDLMIFYNHKARGSEQLRKIIDNLINVNHRVNEIFKRKEHMKQKAHHHASAIQGEITPEWLQGHELETIKELDIIIVNLYTCYKCFPDKSKPIRFIIDDLLEFRSNLIRSFEKHKT